MDKPARSSTPRPRQLRMALQLTPDPTAIPGLEELLARVLDASGGKAGLLTTWDADVPTKSIRTVISGLQPEAAEPLVTLLEKAGPGLAAGGVDNDAIERLEAAAQEVSRRARSGPLHAVALPVRAHDRFVGLICLLYASDTPSLLKDAPGIYNLIIDHVEVVVESARLLQRLFQERRWLEAVVHHQTDGVVILDRDGLVIGFNAAVEALTGWALPQAVGKPASEVFAMKRSDGAHGQGPSLESVALALKGGSLRGSHAPPVEALLRLRDGRWVDVEVTNAALQDERGRPLGWVMTLRDIRERKEMERLQRIFLSALSHELQTPIAIIKGFAGLMSDENVPLTVEQARAKAAVIHEESERLEGMVKQML
ncbi:MAG TPA: PAS domain-containing protein, partial [Candidatus Xenobia bacterium]